MATVIIQGEVTKWTKKSIERFKSITNARIILSTWKGQEIDTDIDVFYLDDPGPGPIQNFNRQMYGVNAILPECNEHGLIFKTRSDAIHNVDPFEVFYPDQTEELGILQNKLFISSVMSVDPFVEINDAKSKYRLFSPSDWFFLGYKNDIQEWFNIQKESIAVAQHVHCCEQIFCVSNLLKQKKNFDLSNWNDISNQQLAVDFIHANLHLVYTNRTLQAAIGRYINNLDTNPLYLKETI